MNDMLGWGLSLSLAEPRGGSMSERDGDSCSRALHCPFALFIMRQQSEDEEEEEEEEISCSGLSSNDGLQISILPVTSTRRWPSRRAERRSSSSSSSKSIEQTRRQMVNNRLVLMPSFIPEYVSGETKAF